MDDWERSYLRRKKQEEIDRKIEQVRAEMNLVDMKLDAYQTRLNKMHERQDEEGFRAAQRGQLISELAAELPNNPFFAEMHARIQQAHEDACAKLAYAHEAENEAAANEARRLDAQQEALADRMRALAYMDPNE